MVVRLTIHAADYERVTESSKGQRGQGTILCETPKEEAVIPCKCSSTRLQHLIQDSLQSIILQCGSYSLFVTKLLVHLVVLIMAVFLASDIDPVVGRKSLLQSHPNSQTNNCRERAVRDGRRNFHSNLNNSVGVRSAQGGRRRNVNITEVNDRELTQRHRMFRVGNG